MNDIEEKISKAIEEHERKNTIRGWYLLSSILLLFVALFVQDLILYYRGN